MSVADDSGMTYVLGKIYADASGENADCTKGTWDLGLHTAEELRSWIAAQGMTVESFKRLPVYRRNVDHLPFLREL
jgi:hypothetical protein